MSKIFKQYNLKWIGPIINVFYLTAPLFGIASYVMVAITMYTVIMPYIKPVVPWLTIGIFFLILAPICISMLLLFYKFIFPSYFAFVNKQTYIHQNPIERDLTLIKKKLEIRNED